ncbi:MAG: hypothetical protein M4D80_24190 [Myxococcota bacterium]|nr:hypothetical protein [Myxococcota bacterium]
MRFFAIALLVVGCGSSSKSSTKPEQPAETPAEKAEREAREVRERRREEIDAMKPAEPYELRDKLAYQTSDRCGQGPYRFETDSLKTKFGERIEVYACGKHAISGNYRMTTTRKSGTPSTFERSFGSSGADNAACKGKPVAAVVTSGGGGGGSGGGGGTGGKGSTAAAPAKVEPTKLSRTTNIATDCVRTYITEYGWQTMGEAPALDGRIAIDIWSAEPNDLEGLVFVIERHGAVADMTRERWDAYQKAYGDWYVIYRKHQDDLLATGDWKIVDNSVKTPPPPAPRAETPTPRPSKNARWIPGYWLYEETKFHWITGLWDVPEEDIKKELTVQAPTPPPAEPVRVEAPVEPAPSRTAVWTPGSWQWNGAAYIWIAGAWRIPPTPHQVWQPPTWTVRPGRAVYVPGGWRVRIGR